VGYLLANEVESSGVPENAWDEAQIFH